MSGVPLFSLILNPPMYTSDQEFALVLDITTLILVNANGTFSFSGLAASGGNVEGMTVVFMQPVTGFRMNFLHESLLASSPSNRFLNDNSSVATTPRIGTSGYGSAMYRYSAGTINRWQLLGKTF